MYASALIFTREMYFLPANVIRSEDTDTGRISTSAVREDM